MCTGSKWIAPIVAQIWVVSGVLSSIGAQGVVLGFSSNLMAELKSPESAIKIDIVTESWLLGCIGLTSTAGSVIATVFMYYCGRRWAYIITLLPGTLGVLLLYYGSSISVLMAARVFGGFTGGAVSTMGVVVIGEYTSPKHRGMFLNLKTASLYFGCALAHVMGNLLYWRTAVICFIVPHAFSLLSILTWPESPTWLAYRGRYSDCKKAFYWLRSAEETTELDATIDAQREKTVMLSEQRSVLRNFWAIFTNKSFLKPLFVNFLCALLLESTGRHIFPSYALQIVAEVTERKTDPFYYTLMIDLIITMSAAASSVLAKFISRRTLLFASGILTVLVLLALCPYLYLVSANSVTVNQQWIPILLIVAYFVAANIGCVPISLGLTGETYPFEHKSVGLAITGIMIGLCMMIALKSAPYMILYLKMYGTFAILGSVMTVSLVLLYFLLPETKDRTLQEIDDYYTEGRFGRVRRVGESDKIISD